MQVSLPPQITPRFGALKLEDGWNKQEKVGLEEKKEAGRARAYSTLGYIKHDVYKPLSTKIDHWDQQGYDLIIKTRVSDGEWNTENHPGEVVPIYKQDHYQVHVVRQSDKKIMVRSKEKDLVNVIPNCSGPDFCSKPISARNFNTTIGEVLAGFQATNPPNAKPKV